MFQPIIYIYNQRAAIKWSCHYRNFRASPERAGALTRPPGLREPKYLTISTCGQKPQARTDKRPERDTFSNVRGIVPREKREKGEWSGETKKRDWRPAEYESAVERGLDSHNYAPIVASRASCVERDHSQHHSDGEF